MVGVIKIAEFVITKAKGGPFVEKFILVVYCNTNKAVSVRVSHRSSCDRPYDIGGLLEKETLFESNLIPLRR